MAEYPVLPTDYDKIDWAEGGTYSVTDPGGAKRLSGWQPENEPVPGPGEIIPAPQSNWLQQLVGRMLTYFLAGAIRMFSDIHEALDAGLVYPQVCLINPGMARGTNIFDVAGTAVGGASIIRVCTDGRYIYYIGGGAGAEIRVVSANQASGTERWDTAMVGLGYDVCSDGAYVYGSSAGQLIDRFLISDGTKTSMAGTTTEGCRRLATNGVYLASAGSTGGVGAGSGVVTQFNTIHGAMAQHATQPDTGSATLTCICMDHDTVYVGGQRSTYDIWAYNLADMTVKWRYTILAAATCIPSAMATDGNAVYVATDLAGGVNFVMLNCVTGALMREGQLGGAEDLDGVCCDDQLVHVSNATSNDIHSYTPVEIHLVAAPIPILRFATTRDVKCCDGVSVISIDPNTGNLTRDLMGRAATHFQIAETDNPDRRPFHHVAIPAGR